MKYDLGYVLDCALDGIFIVANDHRLVLFNRACEELYDISREDVIQNACWKLSDFKSSWEEISRKSGKITYGELASKKERMTLLHKNGKKVWTETTYTPIFDESTGDMAYVMGVIKDITELKRIEDEKEQLQIEIDKIRKDLEEKYDFSSIVGRSPEILQALKLAAQVAQENTTIILLGESGTGKELLAKAIHYNSSRSSKPFIAVNCSAFPDTLIESELFGYEKGAFTGADKSKPGKIGLASGGTLFLDEIAEMSPPAQAKILRVIQEREYESIGSVTAKTADIRIITATNKNLEEAVAKGAFRQDLFYRLFVFPIVLPSLRDRIEDIPVLVEMMLARFNHKMAKQVKGISNPAMSILTNYHWPGNVRELQNVIERLMILSQGEIINVSDLPNYLITQQQGSKHSIDRGILEKGFSMEEYIEKIESRLILQALEKCKQNKTKAAEVLGISRSTLRYKISHMSFQGVIKN